MSEKQERLTEERLAEIAEAPGDRHPAALVFVRAGDLRALLAEVRDGRRAGEILEQTCRVSQPLTPAGAAALRLLLGEEGP